MRLASFRFMLTGLLLLVPAPILHAARLNDSPFRLVIVVVAYLLVVKGLVLILSPFRFRHVVDRWLNTDAACRKWGGAGLVAAVVMVLLGLTVLN